MHLDAYTIKLMAILLWFFLVFCLDFVPPKPFYVWTFNENMGKWANDLSNWNQKWELEDGSICLRNIPPKPEVVEDDDMPWLAVNSQPEEEEKSRNSKAPLWSPPIRKTTGMRCITMDYTIRIDSLNLGDCGLSVLLQQDG